MSYLFNELKPMGKYHYWVDVVHMADDTVCRLWSTGGIKTTRKGWVVVKDKPVGRELCHMCAMKHRYGLRLIDGLAN